MRKIKAILLDLGGVLLNIDYHATSRAFMKLGGSGFDEIYSQSKQISVFDHFETGKISPEEFREKLRHILKFTQDLSDRDIDRAWNAMLLDLPESKINALNKLKHQFPLYLLSNTNFIHVQAFEKSIGETIGLQSFKKNFQGIYYSCEIGMKKPEARAFTFVLGKNGISPDQLLFVDDSAQHIQGAKKLGIHTIHLPAGKDLYKEINAWLSSV